MKRDNKHIPFIELCKKLALLSPQLKEIYDDEYNHSLEGEPLAYLIIFDMVCYLETKLKVDDELAAFIAIINEAWDISLGPDEGMNAFLAAGFEESLSGPEKYTKKSQPAITREMLLLLRPEIKALYDHDWPS